MWCIDNKITSSICNCNFFKLMSSITALKCQTLIVDLLIVFYCQKILNLKSKPLTPCLDCHLINVSNFDEKKNHLDIL